jgi:hypothetical protein
VGVLLNHVNIVGGPATPAPTQAPALVIRQEVGSPLEGSRDDLEWFVQENKGILASLDRDDFVEFKVNAQGSGFRGTDLFKRMMEYFGDNVRGIWGKWVSGTNLEIVNQLTSQGLSRDEAVIRACTANRARDVGFGRATLVKAEREPGAHTNIEVKFTKS